MKKITLLLLLSAFTGSMLAQSETLINALSIKPVKIEVDGKTRNDIYRNGRMIIAYDRIPVVIYEDENFTYWAKYKLKQCGKKATLIQKTYVELKDGTIIRGGKNKEKKKAEKGKQEWFTVVYSESFDKDIALNAQYEYIMQFKN
jgi:hypothetical protein